MNWTTLTENEKDLITWEQEQEETYNEIQKEQEEYRKELLEEFGLCNTK